MTDRGLAEMPARDENLMLRLVLSRLATPARCTAKRFGDQFDSECDFMPCGSDTCIQQQLDAVRQEREDEEREILDSAGFPR